jgi:hypothetical protein
MSFHVDNETVTLVDAYKDRLGKLPPFASLGINSLPELKELLRQAIEKDKPIKLLGKRPRKKGSLYVSLLFEHSNGQKHP